MAKQMHPALVRNQQIMKKAAEIRKKHPGISMKEAWRRAKSLTASHERDYRESGPYGKINPIPVEELSSGMYKSRTARSKVEIVRYGDDSVVLKDGREFKSQGIIRGNSLVAGQIVLASYSDTNQGADVYEVLGFTDHKHQYAEPTVISFKSAKSLLNHYKVRSLTALEELQDKNKYGYHSYMVVKDLNTGEEGAWFYLFKGRWSRGSGAEPLSFVLLKQINPGKKNFLLPGFADDALIMKAMSGNPIKKENREEYWGRSVANLVTKYDKNFSWEYPGYMTIDTGVRNFCINATPFWDGTDGIDVEIRTGPDCEYDLDDLVLQYNVTGSPETDAKNYIKIMRHFIKTKLWKYKGKLLSNPSNKSNPGGASDYIYGSDGSYYEIRYINGQWYLYKDHKYAGNFFTSYKTAIRYLKGLAGKKKNPGAQWHIQESGKAWKKTQSLRQKSDFHSTLEKAFLLGRDDAHRHSAEVARGLGINPYPHEHAARIHDPKRYVRFRRKNDEFGKGIHTIYGIRRKAGPQGGHTDTQAIRFDARKFTAAEARKWLYKHGFAPYVAKFEPATMRNPGAKYHSYKAELYSDLAKTRPVGSPGRAYYSGGADAHLMSERDSKLGVNPASCRIIQNKTKRMAGLK